MRSLILLAAISLSLSACSGSHRSRFAEILGFGYAIDEPGPTGVRINEGGVFANFFPLPGADKRPGVLLLGGSEGGLSLEHRQEIKALTSAGFNVLYLCYFGCPGTPSQLTRIPLETFDRGLTFLRSQPSVDSSRIAVLGESKGAEAALLVGARDPSLKAIVAAMPSSVVWPGIEVSLNMKSSWTAHGTPVAYLPYSYGSFFAAGMLGVYAGALSNLAKHPDAVIAVERIPGPILLICGEADTLWPSCPMADQISARLREKGQRPPVVMRYKDAGHKVFGFPLDRASPDYDDLASDGGTIEGNAAARVDSWPKAIAFLQASLIH